MIFVVLDCDVAHGGYVFDSYSGSARNAFLAGQNANPQERCLYDGSAVLGSEVVTPDAVRVHTIEFSGSGMRHRIGCNLVAEGASGKVRCGEFRSGISRRVQGPS